MNNLQIAKNWELWKEYMDPGAEDSRERFNSLSLEQRLEELERCFGKETSFGTVDSTDLIEDKDYDNCPGINQAKH